MLCFSDGGFNVNLCLLFVTDLTWNSSKFHVSLYVAFQVYSLLCNYALQGVTPGLRIFVVVVLG